MAKTGRLREKLVSGTLGSYRIVFNVPPHLPGLVIGLKTVLDEEGKKRSPKKLREEKCYLGASTFFASSFLSLRVSFTLKMLPSSDTLMSFPKLSFQFCINLNMHKIQNSFYIL